MGNHASPMPLPPNLPGARPDCPHEPRPFPRYTAHAYTVLDISRDAGGFVTRNTESVFDGLSPRMRQLTWISFVLAVILLGAARLVSDGAPSFRLERTR